MPNPHFQGGRVKTPKYVILHELAHLIEKNHDEKFMAIRDMYMPNWREMRKKLNGQILD